MSDQNRNIKAIISLMESYKISVKNKIKNSIKIQERKWTSLINWK